MLLPPTLTLGDLLFWLALFFALAIAAGGFGALLADRPTFKSLATLWAELRHRFRR